MAARSSYGRGRKKTPKPLDDETLRELALRYVGRYATTEAKLRRYLERKLRERGWSGADAPDIGGLAARFAELGYVDDRSYGDAKARDLSARGYGPMRVRAALRDAGIDRDMGAEIAGNIEEEAALEKFARRRRIGPYATAPRDAAQKRKDFAAALRAGHDYRLVKALLGESAHEEEESGEMP